MADLIVEDGSIVAGADSYISLDDALDLAKDYGIELPSSNNEARVALRKAATYYMELFEEQYSGERVQDDQALSWPRDDATRLGRDIANNTIHPDLKLAQVEAAAAYGAGEVRPNDDGRQIASEEIAGTLKLAYDNTSNKNNVSVTESDDLLERFFDTKQSFYNFPVSRA